MRHTHIPKPYLNSYTVANSDSRGSIHPYTSSVSDPYRPVCPYTNSTVNYGGYCHAHRYPSTRLQQHMGRDS